MSKQLRIFKSIAAPCAIAASLSVSSMTAVAHAATLDIGASASTNAGLQVNSGVIADDISIPPGVAVIVTGSADSAVDDASAVNTTDSYAQVGNPFTDPPTPFIATAFDETTQPDGDQARGLYYVESTVTPDDNGKPVLNDRILTSTADLDFADLAVNASASSGFEFSRDLILTNTSETTAYAFSISTGFDVDLMASTDDFGSQSIAEAVFSLSFITSGTVALEYFGPSARSSEIDDADPGVSVSENLVTSNVLFDGVYYEASVSAMGLGAPTEGALSAVGRFLFSVMMYPSSSLRLSFFQSQSTMTSYIDPSVAEVPLPASALLFLGGVGAFAGAKRKRSQHHDALSSTYVDQI
ncbi:VPLPA-CTERM sorting domain-containing protein [Hyphococcus sp.]|uniref:VPLPA-CTERM sorting domain-containing protein n=1 Tax=Hyphococcus sp. TaxID=2038636 RepID=UPI0035C71AA4